MKVVLELAMVENVYYTVLIIGDGSMNFMK